MQQNMSRIILYLFVISTIGISALMGQDINIECEKIDAAISLKMQGDKPSARVIVFSTIKLSYSSNMGDINMEKIGRSAANGIYTDTLYFFLSSQSMRRRLTMTPYGYYPNTVAFNFKPKETYHCKVIGNTVATTTSPRQGNTPSVMDQYFTMAQNYEQGIGMKKSEKEALFWYTKSADAGHAEANYILGTMYARGGETFEADLSISAGYFLVAARQNHKEAQIAIAQCYLSGEGVSSSYNEGFRWMRAAADQGSVKAQKFIGKALLFGEYGINQNTEQAILWLKKATAQKDIESMLLVGRALFDPTKSQTNNHAAVQYFNMAALLNYEETSKFLFQTYINVNSPYYNKTSFATITQRMSKTMSNSELANKIANQLVLQQQIKSVMDSAETLYAQQHYPEAVALFSQGITLSNGRALNGLGKCYLNGYGVEQNYEKAESLFSKALKECDSTENAPYYINVSLGDFYQDRNNPAYDLQKSISYYTIAASPQYNNPDAQNKLGLLYIENSLDSFKEALQYMSAAARQGHPAALLNEVLLHLKWQTPLSNGSESVRILKEMAHKGDKNAMLLLSENWAQQQGISAKEGYDWRKKAAEDGDSYYVALLANYIYNEVAHLYKYDFEYRVNTKEEAVTLLINSIERGGRYGYSILVDWYSNHETDRDLKMHYQNLLLQHPEDDLYQYYKRIAFFR